MQVSSILACTKNHSNFCADCIVDISFEVQHSLMSIHSRIGAGSSANTGGRGDDANGFFMPKTNNEEDASIIAECPFWMLLARSIGTTVEFIAIPGRITDWEPAANEEFYLRANLMLPESAEVTNIAFYGDNGISSLSPILNDNATVKEGRQSLGLVLALTEPVSGEVREELWVFKYDDIIFQKFSLKRNAKNEVIISAADLSKDASTDVMPSGDGEGGAGSIIIPKSRHINNHQHHAQPQRQSQVNLCGSRGTGGIVTFGTSTFLNIFDLEEDEDNASSGDDDESMDEEGP